MSACMIDGNGKRDHWLSLFEFQNSHATYRPNVSILMMHVRTQETCFVRKIFDLPVSLPPGQDRLGLFPTLGPKGPDLSRGLPGVGWLQVELNHTKLSCTEIQTN